jgi:hypothetical protein
LLFDGESIPYGITLSQRIYRYLYSRSIDYPMKIRKIGKIDKSGLKGLEWRRCLARVNHE